MSSVKTQNQTLIALLCVLALTGLLLFGCSSASPAAPEASGNAAPTAPAAAAEVAESPAVEAAKPSKFGLILSTGGLGDKGFNDSLYAGAVQAKEEFGLDFDYVEPVEISEFEGYQRDMAASGEYDLIIAIGFTQIDPLLKVAAEYPDQKFVLIDGDIEDVPNVASVTFRNEEMSFLVGALAAFMTTTEGYPQIDPANAIIGALGGEEIPPVISFMTGYVSGAKYINPDIDVIVDWSGTFADPAIGKEHTLSMYDRGADIVYLAAGATGLGGFEAAKERNRFVISLGSQLTSENYLAPDNSIASAGSALEEVVRQQVEAIVNGSWTPGHKSSGLVDRTMGWYREGSNVEIPDEFVTIINDLEARIVSGELAIPSTYDEVEPWLADHHYTQP